MKDLAKRGELKGKDALAEATKKYKQLSDDERLVFEKQHKREQIEYQIKLNEHKKFLRNKVGKAATAFNLYYADKVGDYDRSELDHGDVIKSISEKWKNESEFTRKKYEDASNKQKEQIDENKKTQAANLEKPKRNLTAGNFYVKENYESFVKKNPKVKRTEILGKLLENFKNLSDKERKYYEDKAATDKARYEEEIKEFEEVNGIRGRTQKNPTFLDWW